MTLSIYCTLLRILNSCFCEGLGDEANRVVTPGLPDAPAIEVVVGDPQQLHNKASDDGVIICIQIYKVKERRVSLLCLPLVCLNVSFFCRSQWLGI